MAIITICAENNLKIKKANTNKYRIVLKTDRWGLATSVVDIIRTEHNEWSVCDDNDIAVGAFADDKRRYVFIKLRAAKAFAMDLAKAIKEENPYPRICDDKYLDLEC